MNEIYKVSFNIDDKYGYFVFDETTHSVDVIFADEEKVAKLKAWLDAVHMIETPDENGSVYDFSPKPYQARKSKQDFQTVLTRIWEQCGAHVNWSLPSEDI